MYIPHPSVCVSVSVWVGGLVSCIEGVFPHQLAM